MEDPPNDRDAAIRAALERGRSLLRERRFDEVVALMQATSAQYSISAQPFDRGWPFPTANWFDWDRIPVEPQIAYLRDAAESLLSKLDIGSDRAY